MVDKEKIKRHIVVYDKFKKVPEILLEFIQSIKELLKDDSNR